MEYLFGISSSSPYNRPKTWYSSCQEEMVFLNVPYGLSYCRLRIIEESKEYGVSNANEDNQYTARIWKKDNR